MYQLFLQYGVMKSGNWLARGASISFFSVVGVRVGMLVVG